MVDYTLSPSPFLYEFKLPVTLTTPEVDATLYHQLVGKIMYLTHTHPYHSFVVGPIA